MIPTEGTALLTGARRKVEQRQSLEAVFRYLYIVLWITFGVFCIGMTTSSSGNNSVNTPSSLGNRSILQQDGFYFPSHFVWGAATSAYQIEGATHEDGRGLSIWDTFASTEGAVDNGDTADIACDHYHRVDEDVALMVEMGLKAYRFSIAWPRILPDGSGKINQKGIDFYNHLIDTLLENDIQPWVTLYHWDLPQALEDRYGGWLGRQIVDDFANYADVCFQAFGDRVQHWITLNESWTVAVNGYNNAVHAPGHFQNPGVETYQAAHHLILAHATAVRIYRHKYRGRGGTIGISNCGDYRYPLDKVRDLDAAERAMVFQIGWFADPIWKGDYPQIMKDRLGDRLPAFTPEEKHLVKGSSDFFGLNHYSSLLAAEPKELPDYEGYWADMSVDFFSKDTWPKNSMGWSSVPSGCRHLLIWIAQRYQNPPIYMTENGSSYDEPDEETALHDYKRRDYLLNYIRASAEAMERGVNIRGYFAWSLMDNFEWQFGYSRRFGLVRVDFDDGTLERTPKESALWYRSTIEANGANIQRLPARPSPK